VGHGHVQADRSDPVWADWATVLPVLPELDALMPLEGASRVAPLLGGYAFAEHQSNGVYHPAVDLNAGGSGDADLGKPVRTPTDGVVRAVLPWDGFSAGFGNHVWLEATDGHWLHLAHLHTLACHEGERLARGALVGTCGKTGNWQWAHTHWEVTYAKPSSWMQWPTGWSKDRVLAAYMDPFAYLAATWPAPSETGEGNPEMEEPVLSDAELAHKAQAQEWGEFYPGDAAIDFAIPARWRAELRQGRQLGKPLGPEEDIPDVPGARSQAFQFGRIYYRDGRTTLIA
jgi:murein DD-endopeptidase MepM/ murein hydrolase activator NlpD